MTDKNKFILNITLQIQTYDSRNTYHSRKISKVTQTCLALDFLLLMCCNPIKYFCRKAVIALLMKLCIKFYFDQKFILPPD
jgi:hypothetical protein